ncbi:class I SAM-dependent methyltransferase [Xanthomonas campestris pv. campestris]|jgi:predicted methyltransferase|uniref:Exported methyltransferase n=1 Tax=Xanthomonas campestris pv. campestris (strain B100) TaxID=509169 RepID=B0RM40_XANCB|nr:class I SAM-dependent methyltransferase [Xanthomonas campestris]AKS14701.1 methyltransferase [Xanthomonas campestris pv. campestris]MBD8247089.1 class I SAM-dependent methyltransferase [Xanthomonas campestris]MCC3254042.1 class I SAM-dependent methyltransferase [Xanthomonas campestris pv. armoraciae]MCC5051901.1 class I SAM-dependent methyltransferase [Xanthomonas campestris pv. aberrans]MCC5075843.1 class I SAM-dependent methyltransferase [Xanthomonas campestris pv. campestris]
MIRNKLACACVVGVTLAMSAPLVMAMKPADTATLPAPDAALQAAIDGTWRDRVYVQRDVYRHPGQTLAFFGIKPTQTVIEITPGGGWYSEILAPYLREKGKYVGAVVDPAAVPEGRSRDYAQRARDGLEKKFTAKPDIYGKPTLVAYNPTAPSFGADNSADLVLTFRNVHNWRMAGQAESMFKSFYKVLKPGGVLGVVEHRAKTDVPADDNSGYVGQAQVIAMAEAAGFTLAGKSELNANPRDTKDYPGGVWTLPPSNSHDAADAAKYKAIGESDRMTLKFVKR